MQQMSRTRNKNVHSFIKRDPIDPGIPPLLHVVFTIVQNSLFWLCMLSTTAEGNTSML